MDGRKLATLRFDDTPAELIPSRQSSRNAVEALTDLALIALSAELLGVMEKAQEINARPCVRVKRDRRRLVQNLEVHRA